MLLRQNKDGALAITQPAHAWLSGLMAAAWGNDHFQRPQPRQEVILAAGLHDIGWLSRDTVPVLDRESGLPQIFAQVPAAVHTKLWRHGVEQACTLSAYAALLVSQHGDTIYDKTFDPGTASAEAAAAVKSFREDQHVFQMQTIAACRRDPTLAAFASDAQILFNKRLIAALDTLSLRLCWGVEGDVMIDDVPVSTDDMTTLRLQSLGDDTVAISPWPFDRAALSVHVEGRFLRQRFNDEAELTHAFARIDPVTVTLRLQPGS